MITSENFNFFVFICVKNVSTHVNDIKIFLTRRKYNKIMAAYCINTFRNDCFMLLIDWLSNLSIKCKFYT